MMVMHQYRDFQVQVCQILQAILLEIVEIQQDIHVASVLNWNFMKQRDTYLEDL